MRNLTVTGVRTCALPTSAARPALEAHVAARADALDVVGVVGPESQLAVGATHSGRIGLLATAATVASGASARAVHASDPHVELTSVPCPDLAPIIQGGFPFDRRVVDTVRSYCEPLRAAAVDTVILGCTHYPLVAPMLQRTLGRDVALVSSGHAVARRDAPAPGVQHLQGPREGGGDDRLLSYRDHAVV